MGKNKDDKKEDDKKKEPTLIIVSPFGIAIVPLSIVREEPIDTCNCSDCQYHRKHIGHA